MTIKVNIAPAASAKEEDDGVECKCTRDTWPLIILLTGIGVAALVILVSVLSLMTFKGVPQVVLSVYLIIMALLGLEAELRRFKFLRSIIYKFVMRYFYFLTSYYVRGAYYIFMGSVLLGSEPLNIICGCVCMGLGVLLIVVHVVVGLPNYTDWQEVQAENEARIRREAAAVAQGANAFRSGSTPGAHDHTQPAGATPAPEGSSSYQPATVPPAPGAYAPPEQPQYSNSAQFTNMQFTSNQDPYSSASMAEREPEVPSARRMHNDDDLARQYYAQQQQQQQQGSYSPRDQPAPPQQQQQSPQVYGVQSGPPSRRNIPDNPFDAADEYQPPRF